jgi:hypothetical protein
MKKQNVTLCQKKNLNFYKIYQKITDLANIFIENLNFLRISVVKNKIFSISKFNYIIFIRISALFSNPYFRLSSRIQLTYLIFILMFTFKI